MVHFNLNSFSKENWIEYVAEQSPLAVKDIVKQKLYEFMKEYKLREEIITNELIEIAGEGWSAKFCKRILMFNYGDYTHL